MNEGGAQQGVFLGIVRSLHFTNSLTLQTPPLPEVRLPTGPLVALDKSAIQPQASSCCGWDDPNPNTYPCDGGNCTWWAKYKRPDIGNYWGNACGWRDRARQEHFDVRQMAVVGAIAVYNAPPVGKVCGNRDGDYAGHVSYVTAIDGHGGFSQSDMSYRRGCNVGDHGVVYSSQQEPGNDSLTFIYPSTPPDSTPPTGNITSPANGSIISNPMITINADASDSGSGVDSVEFYANHGSGFRLLNTDQTLPYSYTWDASQVGDQLITLTIHVIDKAGNRTGDPGGYRTLRLARTPPSGSITSITNGSVTNNPIITISADVSDSGSGVESVDFYANYGTGFKFLNTDKPPPYAYTWDASAIGDQLITLTMYAIDKAGNRISDLGGYRTIRLDRTPPTGSISANHGWGVADSLAIPVDLAASDASSGVRDVRLSNDGTHWGDWQPMSSAAQWLLAGQNGDTATVYVQYRDAAGNVSDVAANGVQLDFYPAKPSSARYRLQNDVVGMNGRTYQSSRYQLSGTSGQALASGGFASSARYRVALGFWSGIDGSVAAPPGTTPTATSKPSETPTGTTVPAKASNTVYLPLVQR